MGQLTQITRQIFQPALEISIVRPLCIQLDYLKPESPINLLEVPIEGVAQQIYEGCRGNLELLHPCIEKTAMNKYEALFDPDPVCDRYRLAFFLNAANQHADHDWCVGALDVTAEHAMETNSGGAILLYQVKQFLQDRAKCYGFLEKPICCTRQAAWDVMHQVLLCESYYLRIHELLMVGLVVRTSSTICEYIMDAAEHECLQVVLESSRALFESHAYVVLHLGENTKNLRGHFSWFFPSNDWTEHNITFSNDDIAFSDTSVISASSILASDDQNRAEVKAITNGAPIIQQKSSDVLQPPIEMDQDDIDSLSNVSDNSDFFHVESKVTKEPRTDEDKDRHIIESIVPHLRDYPLLPPDTQDLTKSFVDMQ